MPESFQSLLRRWAFNLFPAYRRTGARITYLSDDWHEARIRLPLRWTTRNYVGTIFGGSMYAAVDPIYMVLLIRLLGPDYVVWDKAATIRFLRPGRTSLTATFRIGGDELGAIRTALETDHSIDRVYHVELVDAEGVVCAEVEKVIYIRRKRPQEDA